MPREPAFLRKSANALNICAIPSRLPFALLLMHGVAHIRKKSLYGLMFACTTLLQIIFY